jgi:cyclopropane-fatty-acyl-phospholipid synthase
VVVQLLKRLTGGTVRLVDAFGDTPFGVSTAQQASPPIAVIVRVHDTRAYARILREGSIGLGESYADGWWDTDDLSGFLRLAHRSLSRTHPARDRMHQWLRPVVDPVARRRRADKDRDARNVRAHYDLGNEFFQRILDETMMYSCAVFERPTDSLADASVHKLDRLANLVALAPGDRVLEIGTGWGGLAVHAATHYGCHVTTTTISPRQYEYAKQRVEHARLEGRVTVLADDYRDLEGTFDKIIAIEMIEAVDWREYDTFFAHCRRLLHDAGALTLQAIVVRDESFDRIKRHTDFINAAIFPGGCLPSVGALTAAAHDNGFSRVHEDDIGLHYGETLRRWRRNLTDARDDLHALGFDETFVRRWEFYFSYCEAAFEERYVRDVQLLYTAPAWRPAELVRA